VTCDGPNDLLHAYLDGELDAARRVAYEGHLVVCPDCSLELEAQQAVRTALADDAFRAPPPAGLSERIRNAMDAADRPRGTPPRLLPWLLAASLLVAAGLAGWGLWRAWGVPFEDDRVAQDLTTNHARSLMPGNLLGVESTDRHTVKPWFQGKVAFSFPVQDWRDDGFALKGGRLDLLEGDRRVAALVYTHREHIINVFIFPTPQAGDLAIAPSSRRGYHLCHWTNGGLAFWVVSDLNADELAEFAQRVHDAGP
jgi:anti-sigma factor RsiW